MTINEKRLMIVTGILLLVLIGKSVLIDGNLGSLNEEENQFLQQIQVVLSESTQEKFMYKTTLVRAKVIKIESLSESEFEKLQEEEQEVVLSFHYKAKVRKYFLWIIPFSEITMLK
jgi:hypothetical protein